MNITVKDIIRAYLIKHGYDGLCNDECGCGLDDLYPGDDCPCPDCEPAFKVPDPENEGCYIYVPRKENDNG